MGSPTPGAQALASARSRPCGPIEIAGYGTLSRPQKIAAASRPQTRACSNSRVLPTRPGLETACHDPDRLLTADGVAACYPVA